MKEFTLVALILISTNLFAFGGGGGDTKDLSDLDLSDPSQDNILSPPPSDLDMSTSDDLDIPPADIGGDEDWVTAQ